MEMPGFMKNPFPYMKQAAVFAMSSAWEGMPNVLIESLSLGTQVVSTNCESGPDEILNNGKYGHLVPVGDSKALAEAILQVLAGKTMQIDPNWLDQFTLQASTRHYLDALDIHVKELGT